MPEINDEMRVTADYAISTAKERYGLELEYSEESLEVLDTILEKIYWGFSSHDQDEDEGGLVYNTAIIWGSFLGEYMRLKWGGTWIQRGTEKRISITSIEFSPINFVFRRITNHPEYRVTNFINETKKVIYTSVIHPKQTQPIPETVTQISEPKVEKAQVAPFAINKRIVYATGGVLTILLITFGIILGSKIIKSGGFPAISLPSKATNTYTLTPTQLILPSATPVPVNTLTPTASQLPTYTPKPTGTARPTNTPIVTNTQAATWTPTTTETPTETEVPYYSPTPTKTRTPTQRSATKTPTWTQPPAITPTDTDTPQPSPTNTPVTPTEPPPELQSCSVNPSTVPIGAPTSLTFSAKFSAPGYSLTVTNFDPGYPGQSGCSGSDDNGDGTASCQGSSGLIPNSTIINVTISTPLGNCSVSYRTP